MSQEEHEGIPDSTPAMLICLLIWTALGGAVLLCRPLPLLLVFPLFLLLPSWTALALWMAPGVILLARLLVRWRSTSGIFVIGAALNCCAMVVMAAGIDDGFADRFRFRRERPRYDLVIAAARAHGFDVERSRREVPGVPFDILDCEGPMVIVFPWDGLGAAWNGIVYDETGEIARPITSRDPAWRRRKSGRYLNCSWPGVSLGGNFFRTGGYLYDDCSDGK